MNPGKGSTIGAIFILGIFVGVLITFRIINQDQTKKVLSEGTRQTSPNLSSEISPSESSYDQATTYRIIKVIDGDTVVLNSGETVRLIGIDAPEKNDCFAHESTQEIKRLIEGKEVRIEKDISEADRYQRLLRFVWFGQLMINDYSVRQGFAKAYPYAPDLTYKDQFAQAEQEARENNRGLWGECASQESMTYQSSPKPVSSIVADRDCKDFKTHAEAQNFFGSQGPGDPHGLDSDDDGLACESLP